MSVLKHPSSRLAGLNAIVTGGTSGIGEGIARVFAREGARVALIGRNEENGRAITEDIGPNAHFIYCDVSDGASVPAAVADAVREHGDPDILVNNAGQGLYKTVVDVEVGDWDGLMAVDVRAAMLFAKACIPAMQRRGKGAVVNITSVHVLGSSPADAPYAAAKGALDALTRSMAIDHAPAVRVNSIAPGWVDSALTRRLWEEMGDPDETRTRIAAAQPMRRIGSPEDIGRAAAFLASDDAAFITGARLVVDGGLTALLERWT